MSTAPLERTALRRPAIRRRAVLATATLAGGALVVLAPNAVADVACPVGAPDASGACVVEWTDAGAHDFVVPDEVTEIVVVAVGGAGGAGDAGIAGGNGTRVDGTLVVTPGETLSATVARNGSRAGSRLRPGDPGRGGGGGGASTVFRPDGKDGVPILVAPGGGGGGAGSKGGRGGTATARSGSGVSGANCAGGGYGGGDETNPGKGGQWATRCVRPNGTIATSKDGGDGASSEGPAGAPRTNEGGAGGDGVVGGGGGAWSAEGSGGGGGAGSALVPEDGTIEAAPGAVPSITITYRLTPVPDGAPIVRGRLGGACPNPTTATKGIVIDDDGGYENLTVTATSDNQTLLPDANITVNATQLAVSLVDGVEGRAAVTIAASDGTTTSARDFTVVVGGPADDVLQGSVGPDILIGLGGSDTLYGLAGTDLLCGFGRQDQLFGGNVADVLRAGSGRDTLTGGPGFDAFFCGRGNDEVSDLEDGEATEGCERVKV